MRPKAHERIYTAVRKKKMNTVLFIEKDNGTTYCFNFYIYVILW
jgi:hypothetical protein